MVDGVNRMKTAPILAGMALVITYLLLANPKIPAMFMLLIIGIVSAVIVNPQLLTDLAKIHIGFQLPVFSLPMITWNDLVTGTLFFTLPQILLTLGNAVIAITAENNELFPDRLITEKKIAISQGIMNLASPLFGGIPMCHGAGGMAGHVRFGARTGGALVILGSLLILHCSVLQRFCLHYLQDIPECDPWRDPVFCWVGAGYRGEGYWRQEDRLLCDAHCGCCCHVEYGCGFCRGCDHG